MELGTAKDSNILDEMFEDLLNLKEYCLNCSNEITEDVSDSLKSKGFCSSRCKGEHYS